MVVDKYILSVKSTIFIGILFSFDGEMVKYFVLCDHSWCKMHERVVVLAGYLVVVKIIVDVL